MLHTVTLTYKWILCSKTDIKEYLQDLSFEFIESDIISKMDLKLQKFTDKYDLPNASIKPKITKYRRLNENNFPNDIWNIRNRYYYFEYGLIFWEFTFDTNSDRFEPGKVKHMEIYDNRSVESLAIDKKIRACCDYHEHQESCRKCSKTSRQHGPNIQCTSCELINTTPSNLIYFFHTKNELYQKYYDRITDTPPNVEDNRDFYVFTNLWRIQKNRHIVLIDDKDRSDEIINSIRWTSSLANGLQDHGNEILQHNLSDLPPYFDGSTGDKMAIYIDKFYLRFYYFSPELLLIKSDSRLHLDSRILKTIKYSYECIVDPLMWDLSKENIKKFIPNHFVPLMFLYKYIRITPSSRFNDLAKEINPLYYYDPPNKQFYRYSLTKTQQNILSKMAKEVVENSPSVEIGKLGDQTKFKNYSMTEIMETLLDIKKGGSIDKVRKEVEGLLEHDILVKVKSTNVEKRGPPHDRYYLNPQMPYTEYFLQMHLSQMPEEEFIEITDELFSSTQN